MAWERAVERGALGAWQKPGRDRGMSLRESAERATEGGRGEMLPKWVADAAEREVAERCH
jgi:hypothetical protein